MADSDDEARNSKDPWPVDVPGVPDVGSVEVPGLDDLGTEVESILGGPASDPDDIEAALSDVDVPALAGTEVTASVLPQMTPLSSEEADAVVEAGGEAVALSVEAGEETATVLLDAGDEAVEVVVEDGGEVAAEAVVEVLAAALDGV